MNISQSIGEELTNLLLGSGDPNDLRTVEEELRRFQIAEFIEKALSDPSFAVLSSMASNSYAHDNGFAKISLPALQGSALRLRLHIWRPQHASAVVSDIHNHRWWFASRVLVGNLQHESYHVADSSTGSYLHYRHRQTGPERGYKLSSVGRSRLAIDKIFTVHGEETYKLRPDIAHRVAPSAPIYTATLALEMTPIRTTTDMYCVQSKVDNILLDPPRYTVDQLRSLLAELHFHL